MGHIGDVAQGNWKSLLPALGVDSKFLVNKHGPCPICGGDDRFRWDDQNSKGGYICSQCGGGDGFDLACKVTGKSFREVSDNIAKVMGTSNSFERKQPSDEESRQRERMKQVWNATTPIADISPAAKYLRARMGGSRPFVNYVREASRVFHSEDQQFHPAMVAKVIGYNDVAINLHITYLTRDGRKANVSPAKKVMPGKLPDGCAIRLMPAAEVMGVAEGIETAISASLMFDMPVWACVNGNLLAKWRPPDEAHEVFIFGDNDENCTGQARAYELANRLIVQFKRKATVMIPPTLGDDWNDHFLRQIRAARTAG